LVALREFLTEVLEASGRVFEVSRPEESLMGTRTSGPIPSPVEASAPVMRASSRASNAACMATNENTAATNAISKVTMWTRVWT
jgi:hypothetical protein